MGRKVVVPKVAQPRGSGDMLPLKIFKFRGWEASFPAFYNNCIILCAYV